MENSVEREPVLYREWTLIHSLCGALSSLMQIPESNIFWRHPTPKTTALRNPSIFLTRNFYSPPRHPNSSLISVQSAPRSFVISNTTILLLLYPLYHIVAILSLQYFASIYRGQLVILIVPLLEASEPHSPLPVLQPHLQRSGAVQVNLPCDLFYQNFITEDHFRYRSDHIRPVSGI